MSRKSNNKRPCCGPPVEGDNEDSKKPSSTKQNTSSTSSTESPRKKAKKEEIVPVWRWWKEKSTNSKDKWKSLEHKGPVFAPPYERLPANVQLKYDKQAVKLSEDAEEIAGFYAMLIEHDYTKKDVFNKNFFKEWQNSMTPKERSLITDLKKCDFTDINAYYKEKSEERKALSPQEKKKIKEDNEKLSAQYGYATVDGHKEKIGNFKIEPPGLFRGRGDHPKMGMVKRRIFPEDVIINCSKNSKVPIAPNGGNWKEVRHDNTVTWLASWTENIQNEIKYVKFSSNSKFKGENDLQKYEKARDLARHIEQIRNNYISDFRSPTIRFRQRAVAIYLIDMLALRVGNEKDEDQADTVGCCSLRVEHLKLVDKKDGLKNVVIFDFLAKDSIRYTKEVPVDKDVFENLQIFMRNKKKGENVFDKLNPSMLNKYLNQQMPGLTAKVFRTYNASITLQRYLDKMTPAKGTIAEKINAYNTANRHVAQLCNHKRTVPKSFDKTMENLKKKIESKKDDIAKAEEDLQDLVDRGINEGKAFEKKTAKIKQLKEQLETLEINMKAKEEGKDIALGTSKLNYLDPRITVAWCKKYDVPIEKIYSNTERDKFRWAMDMTQADFRF